MLRIINLKTVLPETTPVIELAAKKLRCQLDDIQKIQVVRRAIDARKKPIIYGVYTLHVKVKHESDIWHRCLRDKNVSKWYPQVPGKINKGTKRLVHRPIIIGAGPAGLLAAFYLAKEGYRPLVLERGEDVDTRTADVEAFWRFGQFKPNSNVQFGEGGAGTFSDGKLTTRINDPRLMEISRHLVDAGAPEEILYKYKPHVGTDILRNVVKNIRQKVIALGGEVRFNSQVTDIRQKDGKVTAVVVNDDKVIRADAVLLGIGHSARDTYEMLYKNEIAIEHKPFAIGLRIEHAQGMIDQSQYGCDSAALALEPADYAVVYHGDNGRTAYSFCMCPGGQVIAGTSEAGGVVTNGMSLHARASGTANSAMVVNVTAEDTGGGPLDGIAFQRKYERLAYQFGGGNYGAPAQYLGDFLEHKSSERQDQDLFSYRPGIMLTDLHQVLPEFVTATLEQAIPYFGSRIKGFDDPQACLTGVETRTSAPVRLTRGTDRMSANTSGLYPIGEGAGYAGGIMSAALDGVESAIQLMMIYKPDAVEGK